MPTTLPRAYPATREALHRVAVYVLWSARSAADGRLRQEPGPGGFGFGPLGSDGVGVRVDGVDLVLRRHDAEERAPLTTLADAATRAGVEIDHERVAHYDVPPVGDANAPLGLDAEAAGVLASWFALAGRVLGDLREEAEGPVSDIVLWPEHFDVAFDDGSETEGSRTTYGLSPGDRHSPEPYVYVLPWAGAKGDPFWNATAFEGAWRRLSELGSDPASGALEFLRRARERVTRGGP